MRRGVAIAVALLVAFACAGRTTEDQPPFQHAPADPQDVAVHQPGVEDGASEAPADVAIDEHVDQSSDAVVTPSDAEAEAAPSVDASDASAPPTDAPDASPTTVPEFCDPMADLYGACGTATCTGPDVLYYWSISDGGCCVKARVCSNGCIAYPQGACCAPTSAECALGTPYSIGIACPFTAKNRCFETLAQACACLGCQPGGCVVYAPGPMPKLKLPPKGGSALDATVPSSWCPWTPSDASAPTDAALPPTQQVICGAVTSDAGGTDALSD